MPSLAEIGITSLWLPPGCKANSPQTNGYDCYDLWDLGEFDQKWSRATKWGDREQLAALVALAKTLGIAVVWDTVLNHKTAGDSTEECWAVEVDPEGTFCLYVMLYWLACLRRVWAAKGGGEGVENQDRWILINTPSGPL